MDFAVADEVVALPARGAQYLGVSGAPKCANRVSHRNTLGVGQLKCMRVECAGYRFTAEVGAVVAQAFFIGKPEHFKRKGKTLLSLVQTLDASKCNQYAEWPIVLACVAHTVEVGAEEQGFRARRTRLVASDEIANRILPGRHAGGLHPCCYSSVCQGHCA